MYYRISIPTKDTEGNTVWINTPATLRKGKNGNVFLNIPDGIALTKTAVCFPVEPKQDEDTDTTTEGE